MRNGTVTVFNRHQCCIDYLGKKLPALGMHFMNGIIDDVPNISVITKIEVLGFNTTDENAILLTNFINDATVFDLTDCIVDICIQIRKRYKTKLPDSIIAATAIAYNLVLVSRNLSDFKNIEGLNVINPYSF